MRYESLTFGECFSINLSSDNGKSMYVSKGFAHGFLTLSESATVAYLTTTVQNSQAESGVKWNSFGFNWPVRKKAILSKRDLNLPTHKKYEMF
jgi:dTDP-4-dehydrorhamnose 3,5-epimerase